MIVNPDRRGRTRSGRVTYRPLLQFEPDDFPPDSLYWERYAKGAQKALEGILGSGKFASWEAMVWPLDFIDGCTWRLICEATESALALATNHGERDLQLLAETARAAMVANHLVATECSPSTNSIAPVS